MKTELIEFDAADYLDTPESVISYLTAALEEGGTALFKSALADAARAWLPADAEITPEGREIAAAYKKRQEGQ